MRTAKAEMGQYFPQMYLASSWGHGLYTINRFSILYNLSKQFHSLPNDKILDCSNLKDFAEDEINQTCNMNFVSGNFWKCSKHCG